MSFLDELNKTSRNKSQVESDYSKYLTDVYYSYLNMLYGYIQKQILSKAQNGEYSDEGTKKKIIGEYGMYGSTIINVPYDSVLYKNNQLDTIIHLIEEKRISVNLPIGHTYIDEEYHWGRWALDQLINETVISWHYGLGILRSSGKTPAIIYYELTDDAKKLIYDLNKIGSKDSVVFDWHIHYYHRRDYRLDKPLEEEKELVVSPNERIHIKYGEEYRAVLYLKYTVRY